MFQCYSQMLLKIMKGGRIDGQLMAFYFTLSIKLRIMLLRILPVNGSKINLHFWKVFLLLQKLIHINI